MASFVPGSIATINGAYDPANSTGIAKMLADAFQAGFGPGFSVAGVDTRTSLQNLGQALYDAISAGTFATMPIGSIIGVRTDLAGVSTPDPLYWKPMDGTAVADPLSPLNGVTIEDWNGGGRFLRGGATAGVEQAADAVVPDHSHAKGTLAFTGDPLGTHSHAVNAFTGGLAGTTAATTAHNITSTALTPNTSAVSAGTPTGTITGSTASDGGSGSETRPINGSVVWYIKVR